MSLGSGYGYRRSALRRHGLVPGMRVLDVATGTGLVARAAMELLGPKGEVVGLDPSRGMLDVCRGVPRVSLVQGSGDSLPFADGSFDFVTMGYALRHVDDIQATFREYRRVLRPGGRVLILEISRPDGPVGRAFAGFYFGTLVPLAARVTLGGHAAQQMMAYYWDTIRECVPPEAILDALGRAGFDASERIRSGGIFSEFTALA